MKHLLILSMIILYQIGICQELPCRNWYTKTDRNGNTINVSCKEAWSKNSNGQKHGKYISYYENGNPHFVATYVNGLLNGKYVQYELNGTTIIDEGNYANEKRNGNWKIGFSTGAFKEDKRIGVWKFSLPNSATLTQDYTLNTYSYSEFSKVFKGSWENRKLNGECLMKIEFKKMDLTSFNGIVEYNADISINGFNQFGLDDNGKWVGKVTFDRDMKAKDDLVIAEDFESALSADGVSAFKYPMRIDKDLFKDILTMLKDKYNLTSASISLKFNSGTLDQEYSNLIFDNQGKKIDEVSLLKEANKFASERELKLAEQSVIENAKKETELKEKPDRDTFNEVVKEGTIDGYFYYLETFPNGIYANEIRKVIKYGQARFFENTQGITTRELFERYNNGSTHKTSFVQFNGTTFKIDLTQPRTIWVRDSIYQTVLDRATKEKNLFDMILYYDAAVVDNCPEEILMKYGWVVSIVQAVEETVKQNYSKSNATLSNTVKNYLTDFLTGTNYLLLGEKKLAKDFIRSTQREATLPNNQYLPGVYQQVSYFIDLLVQNGIPKEAFQKLASFENDKAKVSEAQVASFVK